MKGKEREREEYQLVKANNANNQVNTGKCYLLYYFFQLFCMIKISKNYKQRKISPTSK